MVHVLLKPGLEKFEHYFASVWDECNCAVVWTFFGVAFMIGMKTDLFQSCGHCWVFQICWHIECSTFRASSFRIWNSSTGILSPPLALFVVMLSKAHLTSHSRMSGSRWVISSLWLSGVKLGCLFEIFIVSFLKNYLFVWLLWVLVVVRGIFSCGMWDLVPWPGIEPEPLALGG